MFAKRTGRGLSPAAQEGQCRPPSLGWGVSASTHGPAFLRRGAEPTSSVLATHTKEKKRQRKERKKKRPQLQPRFSNRSQQEQNSSVDQSSPERIDNNNEIGVLSFLGFVRKWFLLSRLVSVNWFWVCLFVVGSPVKQDKMPSVYCFLFFAWVRSVLGSRPKKERENRTERTLGCSGRSSASSFFMVFASPNGQSKTARVRSGVTVGFYGFSFSEGSVSSYKLRQTNRACC